MMRKDIKYNWGEKQQKAFKELKERFTTELVLVTLDLDRDDKLRLEIIWLHHNTLIAGYGGQ